MSNLELTYRSFVNRISDTARKDILSKLSYRALLSACAFVIIALLLIALEAVFGLSSIARKLIFFGYLSFLFATSAVVLILLFLEYTSVLRDEKISYYAGKIGSFFPEIKDGNLYSNELSAESINLINQKTSGVNFSGIVSYKKSKPFAFTLGGSILLSAMLFIIFPSTFNSSLYRLVNYNYTFIENSLGIAYEVKPGSVEISKGEDVRINARILFNDPNYKTEEIKFNTKTVSNEGVELSSNTDKLTSSSPNEFATTLAGVNSNTVYWFEYKGIKSDEYKISITSRPVIKSVKITIYPPAYTKLPSRSIDGNEITTIAGSKVYVEAESSDEMTKSIISFGEGKNVPMEINGSKSVGTFTASANGTFRINIFRDFKGKELTNLNPQDYRLRVYPDEYPKIDIIEPEQAEAPAQGSETLIRSRITDLQRCVLDISSANPNTVLPIKISGIRILRLKTLMQRGSKCLMNGILPT